MGVELKRRRGAFRGGRLRAAVAAVGVAALGLTGCTVGEGNGAEEAAQVEGASFLQIIWHVTDRQKMLSQ